MTGRPPAPWRDRLGVFGERDFRLFFTGYTTSLVGAAMVPVALTFAVLQEGRSTADVGYVLAAETVPLVLLLLVGGVIADRLSRKTVMIAADVVRCVSELLLAGLVLSGSPSLWVFMVLAAVIGAGQAFFNPALTGLLPLIASPARLQQANALKGLAGSTGQIVGPAAAGLIVAAGGAGWAIGIDGASYAVSALCLARLHLPTRPVPQPQSFLVQLRTGWREFSSRTWLWVIVVQFGLFHLLVYAPFMVLGAVVSNTTLGGASAWGLILTAQGAGSILGGFAVLRARPRRPLVTATLGTFRLRRPGRPPRATRTGRRDRRRGRRLRHRHRGVRRPVGHHPATTHPGRRPVPSQRLRLARLSSPHPTRLRPHRTPGRRPRDHRHPVAGRRLDRPRQRHRPRRPERPPPPGIEGPAHTSRRPRPHRANPDHWTSRPASDSAQPRMTCRHP